MSKVKSLIRFLNENLLYDGSTNRSFFLNSEIFESLKYSITHGEQEPDNYGGTILKDLSVAGKFNIGPIESYFYPERDELLKPSLNSFILKLTDVCNLNCSYCPYSYIKKTKQKEDMLETVAHKSLEYFMSNSTKSSCLGFFGGEPFLKFSLLKELVDKIKSEKSAANIPITVTTNLTIFNDTIADFLAKNEILLIVSLDGSVDVHNRYRKFKNGKRTYFSIISNLRRLLERHPEYFKNFVVTNTVLSPPCDLDAVDLFFSKTQFPFKDCMFSIANTRKKMFYQSTGETLQKFLLDIDNWAVAKLVTAFNDNTVIYSRLMKGILGMPFRNFSNPVHRIDGKIRPFTPCIPGEKIMVLPNGKFSICDRGDSIIIGDADTGINIEKVQKILTDWFETISNNCLNCWAAGFCHACYLIAWSGEKFDNYTFKNNCKNFKDRASRLLPIFLFAQKWNPKILEPLTHESNENPWMNSEQTRTIGGSS